MVTAGVMVGTNGGLAEMSGSPAPAPAPIPAAAQVGTGAADGDGGGSDGGGGPPNQAAAGVPQPGPKYDPIMLRQPEGLHDWDWCCPKLPKWIKGGCLFGIWEVRQPHKQPKHTE